VRDRPATFVSYPSPRMGRSGQRQMPRKSKANSTDGIEVTGEMVRAGVYALALHDDRFEIDDDAVIRIYKAMRLASPVIHRRKPKTS
jgi:hypothetical protein